MNPNNYNNIFSRWSQVYSFMLVTDKSDHGIIIRTGITCKKILL